MVEVAFIVGNSGALSSELDTPFKDRLELSTGLNFEVTVIDDSAAESTDFSPYNLIVIIASVTASLVDGLKTTLKPIFMNKRETAEDLALGTGTGEDINETVTNIVDNGHYITSPFSTGNLTVYSGADYIGTVTGFSNDVDDLAQESGSATEGEILVIEKNQTLADSSVASERRVFFGMSEGDRYSSDAWTLFDRAIEWLLYKDDIYVAYAVANVSSLTGPETSVKNAIEDICKCVLVDDGDVEYNCENANQEAVVCGGAVADGEIDGMKQEHTRLMYMNRWNYNEIDLASGSSEPSVTQIKIVDTDHFITKYEAEGNLTVYSSSQVCGMHSSWSNDVVDLAQKTDSATDSPLLICEMGDKLDDGTTAYERRIYWGLTQANSWTAAAERLFKRALCWLMGRTAAVVVVVGNSGSLSSSYDIPYINRLRDNLRMLPIVIDDSAAESYDYSPVDLIITCYGCNINNVDGLKTEDTPLMIINHAHLIEFGFVGSAEQLDGDTDLNIVQNTHYITKRQSTGDLTILNASRNCAGGESWSNDVVCLGKDPDDTNVGQLLICDDGDTLSDSTTAAERRCAFPVLFGDQLNASGWELFDRSAYWCLYFDAKTQAMFFTRYASDNFHYVGGDGQRRDEFMLRRLYGDTLDCAVFLRNDENAPTDDTSEMDVIVIGKYVSSGNFANLKDDAIGIVYANNYLYDEFDLGTSQWDDENNPDIRIVDNTHDITDGYAEAVLTVWHTSSSGRYHGGHKGMSQDVDSLADKESDSTTSIITEIDKDETLCDSTTAAERRVQVGFCHEADLVNFDGWILFDRSVIWAGYITEGVEYTKNFTETLNISDALDKTLTKELTETLNISDALSRVVSYTRSYSETLNISDALAKTITKEFTEDLTISDALEKLLTYIKNFSETLTISDSLETSLIWYTLKEAIIDEINATYTVNANQFEIVKKHGEVPVLTANLQDKVSLYYRWLIDYDFKGGFGDVIVYGFILELALVCQLDDNTAYGVDKGLDILRAILTDMEDNINTAISGYQAWYVAHTGIQDVTMPSDRENRIYRYKTSLSFYRNYGVTVG